MMWPQPLEPGHPAPGFRLPLVDREGTLALDEYRGRTPVMIGFFRGLFCAFCRRQIAQLGACTEKLRQEGVETMGVLITQVGRGRLYFRYHPARMPLAADETAATHRAWGVPRLELIEDDGNGNAGHWPHVTMAQVQGLRVNPNGMFPEPLPPEEASQMLNRADGFERTDQDHQLMEQHWTQLDGLFLLDRDGVVRWRYLEAENDPSGLGSFPSDEEMLAAARALLP